MIFFVKLSGPQKGWVVALSWCPKILHGQLPALDKLLESRAIYICMLISTAGGTSTSTKSHNPKKHSLEQLNDLTQKLAGLLERPTLNKYI